MPFPHECTNLFEVLVGLTAVRSLTLRDASTFLEWSVVENGKGRPFPYAGTDLFEVLIGLTAVRSLTLRDASTFLEWSVVVKEAVTTLLGQPRQYGNHSPLVPKGLPPCAIPWVNTCCQVGTDPRVCLTTG